jgi:hypothetical protein
MFPSEMTIWDGHLGTADHLGGFGAGHFVAQRKAGGGLDRCGGDWRSAERAGGSINCTSPGYYCNTCIASQEQNYPPRYMYVREIIANYTCRSN